MGCAALFEYVEGFYNRELRQPQLRDHGPADYESSLIDSN